MPRRKQREENEPPIRRVPIPRSAPVALVLADPLNRPIVTPPRAPDWGPVPTPEPASSGFYPAAVVGWREWDVFTDADGTSYLRSIYGQRSWLSFTGGVTNADRVKLWPHYERMETRCDPSMATTLGHQGMDHPGWNCSCGIWARKEENPPERLAPVWGEVSLWGKVIRYSGGYRAQYAYPKRLYVAKATMARSNPGAEERLVAKLSKAYGVPCEVREREQPLIDPWAWVPRRTGLPLVPSGLAVGDTITIVDPSGSRKYRIATVHTDGTYSLALA